jgi:putative methyltransferase (TIGR04325 family)
MKYIIKELIPPIIWRIIRKKTEQPIAANSQEVFLSYQDALKLCTNDAYEDRELIEVVFKKTRRFLEKLKSEPIPIWETAAYSMISVVNPIIESKTNKINVLDFGGACGAHYFILRSLIKDLKINWCVVETPTMVEYAKALETDEISFFDNFTEAIKKLGKVDLLHTSGTLQCVDDPRKYLAKILNCNAKWLLFNRLGLNKLDRDIITIHSSRLSWNGIGELPEGHNDREVKYPFTFLSEAKFLKIVEEKYSIVAKFNDQSGMFEVNGEEIVGYGLLCRLKTSP